MLRLAQWVICRLFIHVLTFVFVCKFEDTWRNQQTGRNLKRMSKREDVYIQSYSCVPVENSGTPYHMEKNRAGGSGAGGDVLE